VDVLFKDAEIQATTSLFPEHLATLTRLAEEGLAQSRRRPQRPAAEAEHEAGGRE